MFQNKRIYIGLAVGATALLVAKKYFAGGQCYITKDLGNDIAVITGGNTGIGKQTAIRLSQLGCKVIIGARDVQKSQKFVDQMANSKGKVSAYKLDLSDKQSIQEFSRKVKQQLGDRPLNYLVNNAGVMAIPQLKKTKEGLQMQIGVNHFGHFYLTSLLWNSLKKSQRPRVINVSSRAHEDRGQASNIDFDDFRNERNNYNPFSAYSRSKKANVLFARQLQKRMNIAGINGISISLHPGVVRTELARDLLNTTWKNLIYTMLQPLGCIFLKSPKQGAQTSIYGVLQREDKLVGGSYYADCKKSDILSKQCQSDQVAKKLWEASEKAFGIKFDL